MIQKHKIRLNSTESVNSVNKDNKVAVELKQTTKPYFFTNNIREEIDQYEVFQQERDNCTKYRLITTIKPYCTNILFNPVTEIIRCYENNGIIEIEKVLDDCEGEKYEAKLTDKDKKIIYGIFVDGPNRTDMIRNTEYSQKDIGYKYYPGYDIFNNHLLRSKSFKIVNPITTKTEYINNNTDEKKREIFNTLKDKLRRYDGVAVEFTNRNSLDDADPDKHKKDKRLYDSADIMELDEAINANLIEENGWWGFVNKSSVISKKEEDGEWKDQGFNHIINSKESCDFIDMYPDRSLYSFNPIYNEYKHRPEYNWKTYLTYPYKNFYDHELIKDLESGLNAVLIQEVIYTTGINGQDIILFKTYIKHNLQGGSTINLYYKEDDKYKTIENVIISGIGDLDKNNDNFFFYTTDKRLIDELNIIEKGIIDTECRFINIINGYMSEYYIRIFKKLPNLLKNNKDDREPFDKEVYRLGFSNTIYNDNCTQITFTDGIEIDKLLDNRGRPLTEIYLTIIKNNAGNHAWYKKCEDVDSQQELNDDEVDIEFSHCFSDVCYGFDLFYDDKINVRKHAKLSNIKTMHTSDSTNENVSHTANNSSFFGWEKYDSDYIIDVQNEEEFVGDIVEFNSIMVNEIVLSEGQFRFNTFLRENSNEERLFFEDKITRDDYDLKGFEFNYESDENSDEDEDKDENNEENSKEEVKNVLQKMIHHEGYYYKAHYPIQLREWGELKQSSHFDLRVKSVNKVNIGNKIFAVIKTTLPHRLDTSDTVLLCNDNEESDKIIFMKPTYIFDERTFALGDYVNYIDEEYKTIVTASEIADILNNKYPSVKLKLRRYNDEIPFYATKTIGKNRYMWRILNGVGNKSNVSLQEYPFANGYFYINQDINFYLKRQDPFGDIGLRWDGINSIVPQDIAGEPLKTSDYEYKEESEVTC